MPDNTASQYKPLHGREVVADPVQATHNQTARERMLLEVESSTSILERERILKHQDLPTAAKVIGVTEERLRALESGTANYVTEREKRALERYAPGIKAGQLLSAPTPGNLAAATAGRF
jgi:hypothetical protein